MFHFRKGAAITIAALCMLSPLAAGCNNDSSSNALPETTEYVVPVPEDRISESVKGEVVDAQVGKPAEYNNTEKQEKLQVEVEAVKALDESDQQFRQGAGSQLSDPFLHGCGR